MKKSISLLAVLGILFTSVGGIQKVLSSNDDYFIVTAYYSPLPNQTHYAMGNYQAEIRMQGRGIAGASGKKVFSGMLAAPAKYGFGTEIYLEGLGVGSVQDRGGAIVEAGKRGFQYDRIDVWMGHGEEGLKRALAWGTRKVKGKIVPHQKTTINIFNHISPEWALRAAYSNDTIFSTNIFTNSSVAKIKELQKFLTQKNYYNGAIDGVYNDSVVESVYALQKDSGILSHPYDHGAGYWGKKTRTAAKSISTKTEIVSEKAPEIIPKTKQEKYIKNIGPKSSKEDIIFLQNQMKELGLYQGEADGNYMTIYFLLLDYQLQEEVIASKEEIGAGWFGPKTRKSFTAYEAEIEELKKQEKIAFKEKEKQEKLFQEKVEKKSQELEKLGILSVGQVSPEVRELQKILIQLDAFEYKDTAIFGQKTKQSLIEYQLETNVITSENDSGAGIFGPATRKQIAKDLLELEANKKTA